MHARGLAPFGLEETKRMIGDGVGALIERAFARRGLRPDAAAVADFVADYGRAYARATRLFPGVAETLAGLRERGWRLAVCTNKLAQPARDLLDALRIGGLFAAIGGGDSFPVRKPDPAHLLATLKAAGGSPVRAVMVGDHRNDVIAARGAGLPCVFAAWGYGPPEMAEGVAAVAHAFGEIPAIAAHLLSLSAPGAGRKNNREDRTP